MYWKCNGACAYALRVPGSHCGRYVLLVALWWLCRFPGSVERYVLLVALSFMWVSVGTVCHAGGQAVTSVVDSTVAFWSAGRYVKLSGWC